MTPYDDLMDLARSAVALGIVVVLGLGVAIGLLLTLVARGIA